MTRKAGKPFDVIILGAGGAGLFAAFSAGQRGLRVLVLDHANKPGKKILISGGGRCNFTNVETDASRFLSANPHFAKSALSRYTAQDFVELVDRHEIGHHHKTLGQLFCDGSARQIVQMLLDECAAATREGGEVDIRLGSGIDAVDHADGTFHVRSDAITSSAPKLVIATGGPSIPKMGATGFAYDLARRFGLKVVEPRPALVPFTLPPVDAMFKELSGVAVEAVVSIGKTAFREAVLLTHKGLSGPAALQASSYWKHGQPLAIDFLPDGVDLLELKRMQPTATLRKALDALPARLADALVERLDAAGPLGEAKNATLAEYQKSLRSWRFEPNGTEGFAKAEVTVGGISTAELSSRSMEAKRIPGLYAIGECVDVTGWLGGYNFQWAWASGHAAGTALAEH